MSAKGTRCAAARPPRTRGTLMQRRALDRYVRTAVTRGTPGLIKEHQVKAVLGALAAHADGAGWAYATVETLLAESGVKRRSIFHALDALERDGLVERYPTKRTKGDGRGQGATTFRLGAAVRAAVGLYETEWAPDARAAAATPESGPLAHPGTEALAHPERPPLAHPETDTCTPSTEATCTPGDRGHGDPATCTPSPKPLAHPDEQGKSAVAARSTCTPERRNENHPSPIGTDLDPSSPTADLGDDDPEQQRLHSAIQTAQAAQQAAAAQHPGDDLEAALLAAIPTATPVHHDDGPPWQTVAEERLGSVSVRDRVPLAPVGPTARTRPPTRYRNDERGDG